MFSRKSSELFRKTLWMNDILKTSKLQTIDAFNCLRPWHWLCEVLNQNLFHWWEVARWCHVAAPRHHVDQLGQHDDNVAFVYLLRLHPLLGHLLRAKLNESKPSWGTYPTMVAELISGNVGCMRATENLTNFKFPDHPSQRVYFNLTSNTAGSASSPAEVFSGKLLFPGFTCSGSLYFRGK